MDAQQFWTINNKSFPGFPVRRERWHEELHYPSSVSYFSPLDGVIWARRLIVDNSGRPTPWTTVIRHSEGQESIIRAFPAGSLIPAFASPDELLNYPQFILEREFLLTCDSVLGKSLLPIDKLK